MDYPFYFTWSAQNMATPFEIFDSKGCFYTTTENKKIYDFSSTSFHVAFGHSPIFLTERLKSQLDALVTASPKAVFDLKVVATKKLLKFMNQKEGKIFYTTSGAESIENALKMARDVTKKPIILSMENSYHGATLGALSVTGDWRNSSHQTVEEWTVRIPSAKDDPDLLKTEKIIQEIDPKNIAGLCLETITGGNGVYAADQNWWDGINRLKKRYGLLLILDEVVCGFGRTGLPFGYQHYKIDADFICLAKIISGGLIPFGAVYTAKNISDFYQTNTLSCGLTNYATPLGLAAMDSVIDYLKTYKKQLGEITLFFNQSLEELKLCSKVKEIRSIGLLAAIDVKENISFKNLLDIGIYAMVKDERTIVLAPPFVTTKSELQQGFSLLKDLLD